MARYLASYDANDFQAEFKAALQADRWFSTFRANGFVYRFPETTLTRNCDTVAEARASFRAAENKVKRDHPGFAVTREIICRAEEFHYDDKAKKSAPKE
ncbi:hypothetical protein [Bosea sp. 2RAB26]|uniref:hypothetical protein n=1 Tax=Bosea sp. 2RAB26 TaxID=3237476 RepID=UPI003F923C1C